MPFRSKELKDRARLSMRAAVPSAVRVTLVYYLMTQVLSGVVELMTPSISVASLMYDRGAGVTISLFLWILLALYSTVMSFGYRAWILRAAREEQADYQTLLDGFGMVGRIILLQLLIALRMFGWSILMLLAFSIVSAPLIMALEYVALGPIMVLVLVLYICIFVLLCRYDLAPYLLWDHPEDGAGAAVRRSVQLMQPRLWPYIKLHLAFWPWYVGEMLLSLVGMAVLAASRSEYILELITQRDWATVVTLLQELTTTTPGILMSLLTGIVPLGMFFIPYLNLTIVHFYRAATGEMAPYREEDGWLNWTI